MRSGRVEQSRARLVEAAILELIAGHPAALASERLAIVGSLLRTAAGNVLKRALAGPLQTQAGTATD